MPFQAQLFSHITQIPSAVQDLVARSGFLVSLSLLKCKASEERREVLASIDNCVCSVQVSKLRRARDGLWMVNAIKAMDNAWTKGVCTLVERNKAR